jgi:protein-S-isoprenylcysteine O-methyltransferase Ste14
MNVTGMTIFGAGHKIAAVTFPVLAIAIAAGFFFPVIFHFGPIPYPLLVGTGLGLIVIGLSVYCTAAIMMLRAFRNGQLATRGPYALSRNPMYASFIIFTLPGMSLVLNNWVILLVSVVLYDAITRFVKEEEQWLASKFGRSWTDYAARVGRIFPRLR